MGGTYQENDVVGTREVQANRADGRENKNHRVITVDEILDNRSACAIVRFAVDPEVLNIVEFQDLGSR